MRLAFSPGLMDRLREIAGSLPSTAASVLTINPVSLVVIIDVQLENAQRGGPGRDGDRGEVVVFSPLLCLTEGPCRAGLGAGPEGSLQDTAGGGRVISTL